MYSYEIEKAIQAACVLHATQTRVGGVVPVPYVSHVFSVFTLLSDYTDDQNTLVAALLHDTLEDTDYTSEALKEDFGEKVLAIVQAVTEDKTITDWHERKQDYVAKVVAYGEPSLLVCTADKIHNLRGLIDQYHGDHAGYLATFGRYHTEPGRAFLETLHATLTRNLKNDIVYEFEHVLSEFKTFNQYVTKSQANT